MADAPRAKRRAEAIVWSPTHLPNDQRPAPPKHPRNLTEHLGAELGSERYSDVVVVLAAHRPAAAAAPPPAPGGAGAQEEGAAAVGAAPAAAGRMEGARGCRMHAHALVLGLSPVWQAQLSDDAGFQPLPREGTRKASKRGPARGMAGFLEFVQQWNRMNRMDESVMRPFNETQARLPPE
jgi:hypothetical protein